MFANRLTTRLCLALGVLVLCAAITPTWGWWDTKLVINRPVPLLQELEAESASNAAPDAVRDDEQADGGQGGKAVLLEPGGAGLTVDVEVERGLYALFAIARSADDERGTTLVRLDMHEHATGEKRSWTMIAPVNEHYFASGQLYFPAYAGGRYTLTFSLPERMEKLPDDPAARAVLDEDTLALKNREPASLLVDRLELRDVLGSLPNEQLKQQRMLRSDEELAALRRAFAEGNGQLNIGEERYFLRGERAPAWLADGRSAEERRQRNDKLWSRVPDFNDHVSHSGGSPYSTVIGRDRNGLVADAAASYEKTAHAEFGWDAAVLLCAVVEKYPALDYFAQGMPNVTNSEIGISRPAGKSVYRGWAGKDAIRLVTAYDQAFDFIKDNQELADYVGTKIPWVKTPEDVLTLLDVQLLQHSWDAANREYISGQSDTLNALIPLIQGPSPTSDMMLDEGLFTSMSMNMTFRGGVDDQAISSYSRDGVHYIGSTGYLHEGLLEIARVLRDYREAGGDERFNLMDERLYPQMLEAGRTINAMHVAGGFPVIIGDAMDLRVGRKPRVEYTPQPSRVLGGFGAAILESGQFGDDPLKMRAVALRTGIGRGHAHQDTLNIEIFAHGSRMSPDLGGRHEGRFRGSPNMRWNKLHNLVEVDDTNFHNAYPGSTTSATGWTTAFSPQPGAQYMENHARATSHPDVSLYARQTALIDVDDANGYIFDVFRVRGGKVHTYAFHGMPTSGLKTNTETTDATSEIATQYLARHKEGTRREGAAPSVLEADWPMDPERQKDYQGDFYDADRVATTRLILFGQEGELLMSGNATSDHYQYDFPFLYVRSEREEAGHESVFPAIIEPFAGKPFITARRSVQVTPAQSGAEAGVAVEVQTQAGTTDLLYASGRTGETVELDGRVTGDGRFLLLSTDEQGLRRAHMVGGTELVSDALVLRAERAGYEAQLSSVAYRDRQIVVDQPLPTRLLAGAVVTIGNAQHLEPFKLEALTREGEGTRIQHEKTAQYYQSRIVHIDEANQRIETEIEPPVFGSDTQFADGTTVTNEAHTRFWRASLEEGDRWMNLGWPGYRRSAPNTISLEEVPDVDGDGRRVLALIATDKDKDQDGNSRAGEVLLEMDVTRVLDDGETFYFKLPENPDYQLGGWQYNERAMWNEDRSQRWVATYPGSSFHWKLDGPVSAGDFTDAIGDGKVKLEAYLFGPGDTLSVETFVYVDRRDANTYEVRANVPCSVGVRAGDASAAALSADDGKTWQPIEAQRDGEHLLVNLSEQNLADGTVLLRLGN